MGGKAAATLILTLGLGGLLAGCALFRRPEATEPDLRVLTRPMTAEERRALGRDPDHPHQFAPEELRLLLQSIQYARYEAVPIETPVLRVFSDADIERMVPRLQDAFAKSRRTEKVVVEVKRSPGRTLGAFYIADGRVVVKFAEIDGMDHLRPPIALDPTTPLPQWTLIPRNGQQHFEARGLLGLSAKDPSGLTFSLARLVAPPGAGTASDRQGAARPASGRVPAAATAPSPGSGPAPGMPPSMFGPLGGARRSAGDREPAMAVEQYRQRQGLARERLQFLKELKDSGLITEQEYTRKQKEILDQL